MTKQDDTTAYFLSALFGLACAWWFTGGPLPLFAGKLMVESDYPTALTAYQLFVADSWRWPIGSNPHFGGGNIYFADTAPWFTLLAKLMQTLSGSHPQFEWIVPVNFALLPVFAFRLVHRYSDQRPTQLLFVLMVGLNLIMPTRIIGGQHMALASDWIVLWSMTAVPISSGMRASANSGRLAIAVVLEPAACTTLAWLTHAYLGAMATVIVIAQLVWQHRWGSLVLSLVLPAIALASLGAFAGNYALASAQGTGLDLLAWAQSLNWGITGYVYPVNEPWQKDHLVYLGTGVLLLLLVTAVTAGARLSSARPSSIRAGGAPGRVCLLLAALLLCFYATAFEVRIAGNLLAVLPVPEPLSPLYQRFRIAGRFAIPMAYLLILLTVLAWERLQPRHHPLVGKGIALICVALQAADAYHAIPFSTHLVPELQQMAISQREAVRSLLAGEEWTGQVWRDIPYADLENQRLLDALLHEYGAKDFAVAYQTRLLPEIAQAKMGYGAARSGDVIVSRRPLGLCRKQVELRDGVLCLYR